ncbi:MAG: hypothetical protein FJ100_07485 [Deltaproteobacteria bacterium]|nr:hypothetical protein [Deltaproteobacteria bacterium]
MPLLTSRAAIAIAVLSACSASSPASTGATVDATTTQDSAADTAAGGDATAAGADTATTDVPAAADAPADSAADAASPAGTPFGVGLLKVDVAGPGGRKLPTSIWYPIPPGAKGTAVSYGFGLFPSPLGAQDGVAPAKGPFPTVAFSHGNQGVPEQSVFLTEGLAARGYVVVAPEHVGNSFTTFNEKLFAAVTLWRPKDLSAAVDRLAKPEAGDPPWLGGLADTEKLAVTGHSFGGYTSLAFAGIVVAPPASAMPKCEGVAKGDPVCDAVAAAGPPPWNLGDPRCDVAIPLAHALTAGFDAKSLAGHKVPIVLAAATGDKLTPYKTEAEAAYKAMQPPKALLTLTGGDHFSFAQACELAAVAPANLKADLEKLCKPGAVPTIADSHTATLHTALAACDVYLKGDEAARATFANGGFAGLNGISMLSEGIAK